MSGIRNGFEDVETIYDVDKKDICVVLSRHAFTGEYRFGIFKEFKDEDDIRRTSFIKPKHADAIHRLTDTAVARCDVLSKEWRATHPPARDERRSGQRRDQRRGVR